MEPTWCVRATGAHFDVKDMLRAEGFRWHAEHKLWAKEVPDEDLAPTEFWLAANVYSGAARPKALYPEIVPITPHTRFL